MLRRMATLDALGGIRLLVADRNIWSKSKQAIQKSQADARFLGCFSCLF